MPNRLFEHIVRNDPVGAALSIIDEGVISGDHINGFFKGVDITKVNEKNEII